MQLAGKDKTLDFLRESSTVLFPIYISRKDINNFLQWVGVLTTTIKDKFRQLIYIIVYSYPTLMNFSKYFHYFNGSNCTVNILVSSK